MDWQSYKKDFCNYLENINCKDIEAIIEILLYAYHYNRRIFIIGNGGSAANASHFAQDLCKATYPDYNGLNIDKKNKTFKAISLCDNISFITALANDVGYEYIFTDQLKVYAPIQGDILIAISGSGNSKNILNAIDFANNNKLTTIGITGFDGGELIQKVKLNIFVNICDMYIVESIHSVIFHYIIMRLKVSRSCQK
jgi:D-sedoheptulose 7-phosphate isomerase